MPISSGDIYTTCLQRNETDWPIDLMKNTSKTLGGVVSLCHILNQSLPELKSKTMLLHFCKYNSILTYKCTDVCLNGLTMSIPVPPKGNKKEDPPFALLSLLFLFTIEIPPRLHRHTSVGGRGVKDPDGSTA